MGYVSLFGKIENTLASIAHQGEPSELVVSLAEAIVENFHGELGLSGGRVYRRRTGQFELDRVFGRGKKIRRGLAIPADYAPIRIALEQGLVVMDENDPRFDLELEKELGVHRFAAIEVGDGDAILAFDVDARAPEDAVRASLVIFRHAINQKLRAERLENLLLQARVIQSSILPKRVPQSRDYDIAGRTDAAEVVGGDFYDLLEVSESIIGLAIADAAGHGLPAALQVRDIYMGLRMGIARDFKIVRTVERLNKILTENRLVTKFVSMFYGELEEDGLFIFVNAGHNPPLVLREAGGVEKLATGGLLLGLDARATYQRGFVHVAPGDVLVLYTDGIVETLSPKGVEFGLSRLEKTVRGCGEAAAKTIVDRIFERVAEFGGGAAAEDDRTVVVVRRRAKS